MQMNICCSCTMHPLCVCGVVGVNISTAHLLIVRKCGTHIRYRVSYLMGLYGYHALLFVLGLDSF